MVTYSVRSLLLAAALLATAFLSTAKICAESLSILLPPPSDVSLYDVPWANLNDAQRHKLSLYGLRFAPLDPRIWGLRMVDVTESKLLIPIRPFFLRASESRDFQVEEIEMKFRFKKVPQSLIERFPREHDPVIEIGFGSQYTQPAAGELPEKDSGYAARLSAFPEIPSGFLKRDREHYRALTECSVPILETGRDYSVLLRFESDKVILAVDDQVCATISAGDLRLGLISVITSWSPAFFQKFEVRGRDSSAQVQDTMRYSGVIAIQAQKKKKS